jgi:cystathionine beta-lyase/cystathionine gamma-synthase
VTSLVMPRLESPDRADSHYGPRLVRLSIGLEDPAELRADLEAALDRL